MNLSEDFVKKQTGKIIKGSTELIMPGVLKDIFGCIDLTTLNTEDTEDKIVSICLKVNSFNEQFRGYKNVAAVCIYPSFVEDVKKNLKASGVRIASVAGGFPSSQTLIAVKLAETSIVVEKGAHEVDVVMSVGKFLEKKYQPVSDEIALIKAIAGKAHLKVILETGLLGSSKEIYLSGMLAMEAGADFIKTSTGKTAVSATPEAVFVMAHAIKDYFMKTGKKVGLKPSGGIVTPADAVQYYSIVKTVLGDGWLSPEYFRLGASRLANNILTEISKIETGKKTPVSYF